MVLPWPDEMRKGEENTQDNAKAANDDVCNAEEGILASHNGLGGDEDGLGATILFDREI